MGVRKYASPEEAREARLNQMKEYSRQNRKRTGRKVPDGWRYRRHGAEYDSKVIDGKYRAEFCPERKLARLFWREPCEEDTDATLYRSEIHALVKQTFKSRNLVIVDGPLKYKRALEGRHYLDVSVFVVSEDYPTDGLMQEFFGQTKI